MKTTDPDRTYEAWQQARRRKVRQPYQEARSPAPEPEPVQSKHKPPPRQPRPYWPVAKATFDTWIYDQGVPAPRSDEYSELVEKLLQALSDRDHHPHKRTVQMHVKRWIDEYLAKLGGAREIR